MIASVAVLCMASAAYFEVTNNQNLDPVYVMELIEDRVESDRYPNNHCDVVKDAQKNGEFSTRKGGNTTLTLNKSLKLSWKVYKGSVDRYKGSSLVYNVSRNNIGLLALN